MRLLACTVHQAVSTTSSTTKASSLYRINVPVGESAPASVVNGAFSTTMIQTQMSARTGSRTNSATAAAQTARPSRAAATGTP